jgi:alginate O-acetyltransferase complex protein AlgI
MIFNSYLFFIYFPIVTILFFLLPHKFRWVHLLAASFIFYIAFLPLYVFILVITILVDYIAAIYIEGSLGNKKKLYLIISIVANIGFLCFFKYYDFIIDNLNDILRVRLLHIKDLWISSSIVHWNNLINSDLNNSIGTDFRIIESIVLPIGLSFHTFQALSYTIEVYKGKQKAERHLGIYALYVMFYPQLVAGPIERPQHILPQIRERKYFKSDNLLSGLRLMVWGLFKKVVIADRLAIYVNEVYNDPGQYHWINVLIATVFFSVQIYCDFSGYSDIAIGAAKTMGYELMINFRRPYFASNIRSFWEKWHISLSTWFRDYVFIPLGGSRVSFKRLLFNITVVFILSGFWHGANWTFIVWGALHAFYYVIFILWNKYAEGKSIKRETWHWRIAGWLITMFCVWVSWIFFRARDLSQAKLVIKQIFSRASSSEFRFVLLPSLGKVGFGYISMVIVLFALAFMLVIEKHYQPEFTELNRSPVKDIAFISITGAVIIGLGLFSNSSFIYFQF